MVQAGSPEQCPLPPPASGLLPGEVATTVLGLQTELGGAAGTAGKF